MQDTIIKLSCNLDDLTPEALGFAMDVLLDAGALDVYTIPIGMKKNRPATMLNCLCKEDTKEEMIRLLFLHTTTLGIREEICNRYVLDRKMEVVETPYGPVRKKVVSGFGVTRYKLEYEDLAQIAKQTGLSLAEVRDLVEKKS